MNLKPTYAEVLDGSFRFIRAQGVEAVCLNCQAGEIQPEIEVAPKDSYPWHMVRGYSPRQIRSAFSLCGDR